MLEGYRTGIHPMLLSPAWEGVEDPVERIFALLGRYRELLKTSDCFYGCPIGSLTLELHEPDPPVRALLAANFDAWTEAIEGCIADAGPRLPRDVDPRQLATFVLTTMEGGVMLSRTHRDLEAFDAAVSALRDYFARLSERLIRGGPMSLVPTVRCRRIEASIAFYTQRLGFQDLSEGEMMDPGFRVLRKDANLLFLSSHAGDGAFGQAIAVLVNDVDEIVRTLRARGLKVPGDRRSPVHEGPVDQTWGTREFYVDDPDGNTVRFIQGLSLQEAEGPA